MKIKPILAAAFAACLVVGLTGCASTRVTGREQLVTGQLPRPNHIWVYNFAASASEVPSESALAGESDIDSHPTQTPEQIAMGHELGAEIASQLIAKIQAMGLPAAQGVPGVTPEVNDIVLRGYLLSIKPGSAAGRVIVGFGVGGSELRTMVEGFQMTPTGLRKVGTGTIEAGGSKGPGAALGVATFLATANPAGLIISSGMKVYGEASGKATIKGRAEATAKEVADVLKKRFLELGWIVPD